MWVLRLELQQPKEVTITYDGRAVRGKGPGCLVTPARPTLGLLGVGDGKTLLSHISPCYFGFLFFRLLMGQEADT